MRQMQPTEIMPFLERFGEFGDAVIHSIFLIEAGNGHEESSVRLQISCYDLQEEFGYWCSVTIELRHILYFQIKGMFNVANWVYCCGIYILNENDKWGIDFGDSHDYPKSMNELEQSQSYIVAKEIWWDVKPSQET